jgi:cellulose synthase/poly-beta-1,6-N-acetylglucosamine synthase-like glycosyltransferase
MRGTTGADVNTPECHVAKSISIVTASLNHAPFIDDTIRSVLDQRYPHLEYIVIDGGWMAR